MALVVPIVVTLPIFCPVSSVNHRESFVAVMAHGVLEAVGTVNSVTPLPDGPGDRRGLARGVAPAPALAGPGAGVVADAADPCPNVAEDHALLQEGRDPDAAERALRAVLELDPAQAEAHNNLAVLLRQRRQHARDPDSG